MKTLAGRRRRRVQMGLPSCGSYDWLIDLPQLAAWMKERGMTPEDVRR
jgi:hypothetical protein